MLLAACLTLQELSTHIPKLEWDPRGLGSTEFLELASLPLPQISCLPQKSRMRFATTLIFLTTQEEITVGTLKWKLAYGLLNKSFNPQIAMLAPCGVTSWSDGPEITAEVHGRRRQLVANLKVPGLFTQLTIVEQLP